MTRSSHAPPGCQAGPTLVILAAGLGTRYGGLKQIDPVGPNGELIIDYSMYDAVAAGFTRVVFVVRHVFEEAFRRAIGHRLEGLVDTAYAFQELDACLGGRPVPEGRQRPWGTGHAILTARDAVTGPFAVINADDFYGPGAFRVMARFLSAPEVRQDGRYAMVGYALGRTLSVHGTVCRGLCTCDPEGFLTSVTERCGIRAQGGDGEYQDEAGTVHVIPGDRIVSMNLWGFGLGVFDPLDRLFAEFMAEQGSSQTREFYIPTAVDQLIRSGKARVRVLRTDEQWFGVTYRPDRDLASARVLDLIRDGVYPARLWEGGRRD